MINIGDLRKYYLSCREALPFLDCWNRLGTKPFAAAHGQSLPAVELPFADRCNIPVSDNMPVLLQAGTITLDRAEELLKQYPQQNFICVTSERKLIYDRVRLLKMATEFQNFYICTANFTPCMLLLEEFYGCGVAGKLIYGSGLPLFSEDASLGPIIFSALPWSIKCDIAGNTLRRLMNLPEIIVPEPERLQTGTLLIDTHMHFSIAPEFHKAVVHQPQSFWRWAEWRGYMESAFTAIGIAAPGDLLENTGTFRPEILKEIQKLCRDSLGRMRFYVSFNPEHMEVDKRIMELLLETPECAGIKIHPPLHRVSADDDRYDIAFAEAERTGKVVLTHSWEDSSYNPVQKLSLPHLFEKHLKNHPGAKFILGHAGGRPATMEEVCRVCQKYSNVWVDLSGDYFHDGMLETLTAGIGAERILLGSDSCWFNVHAIFGMLLKSRLSDAEIELIAFKNAENLYGITADCY